MPHPPFNIPSLEVLGRLLPGYDFECLIAKGGTGAVYKAKQRSLARDVAIKILPLESGSDSHFRKSFVTEARAMAKLNHPNLIRVYDSGRVDDMVYIVMEYVAGKSLLRSSHGKKVDPVQAVQLVQGICAGIGHAHENGIIHRDIKPSNILLTPKVEPKIGDFGLAQPAGSDGVEQAIGTGYTAPEVITRPEVADRRSDLFAVGVILYELVTGQLPEAGRLPPSSLCGCDPGIDEIWRRATQVEPNKRYQNAREFSAALEAWLDSRDSPAKSKASQPTANPNNKGVPGTLTSKPIRKAADIPTATVQPSAGGSSVFGFLRFAFLIGLLATTAYLWTKKVEQDKKNLQMFEEYKRMHEQDENKTTAPGIGHSTQPERSIISPSSLSPRKSETSIESLERLRTKLASGARAEMPGGSIRRGDCYFLYVPTPMTWSEAAWYAESCGGHLAIPTTTEELSWFCQNAPPSGGLWIGAGTSGGNGWSLVDGTPWKLANLPAKTGPHVGVNRQGQLRGIDSKREYPFLIQWHQDGYNPATLEAALLATRESLSRANPIYPPGTETIDNRNYLYVARPIPWRQAVALAEMSGGHLAVTAGKSEPSTVAQFAKGITAPHGIWLGGSLKGAEWTWITGEHWTAESWAKNATHFETSAALLVRPDKVWDAQDASKPASGFIIEWSKDRAANPASKVSP